MRLDDRVAALLAGGVPGAELEAIDGELFTSAGPTPYLGEVIDRVTGALERAVPAGSGARVASQELLVLAPRTALRPDAAIVDGAGALRLVVEVRTESTDRYALGPKRMAYARTRVPEYWFVDPTLERVVFFGLEDGEPDYRWPGVELGRGASHASGVCPGLVIEVDRVLS